MKKILFISLIFSLLIMKTNAQEIVFSAAAEKVVQVGEQFRIVFEVNKQGTNFAPPAFTDFTYIGGPSTSQSMSTQIINGKVSQTMSISYTYYLQAVKEGTFTIKPAAIKIDGQTYNSNSVTITVVAGAASQTQTQTETNNSTTASETSDLFVKVSLSKTEAYIGEAIIATIKIYTRVDLAGFEDISIPDFTGFLTQDIQAPTQINLERESVDGVIYNAGLIKETILIPQRAGKIEIEPVVMKCVVRKQTGRRGFWGP